MEVTSKIQFNMTALDKMALSKLVSQFADILDPKTNIDNKSVILEFFKHGFFAVTDDKVLIAWTKDFRKRLIDTALRQSKEELDAEREEMNRETDKFKQT